MSKEEVYTGGTSSESSQAEEPTFLHQSSYSLGYASTLFFPSSSFKSTLSSWPYLSVSFSVMTQVYMHSKHNCHVNKTLSERGMSPKPCNSPSSILSLWLTLWHAAQSPVSFVMPWPAPSSLLRLSWSFTCWQFVRQSFASGSPQYVDMITIAPRKSHFPAKLIWISWEGICCRCLIWLVLSGCTAGMYSAALYVNARQR